MIDAEEYGDPEYIRMRNSLIPEAERHANKQAGLEPAGREERIRWASRWNQVFHAKMDQLWRQKGPIGQAD